MPTIVQMPDGVELEYPDGMSNAAMLSATRKYHAGQKAEISAAYDTGVRPSALVSKQAQDMMPDSIRATIDRATPPALQQKVTQDAQRGLGPVYERNRLEAAQQEARDEGANAEADEEATDFMDQFVVRPFASTAENPLGGFGTAAKPLGALFNAFGEVAANTTDDFLNNRPALDRYMYGDPLPQTNNVVKQGLLQAAHAVPVIVGGTLLASQGVPAPLAFGALMGASTFAATEGDIPLALESAALGAVIPGVGDVGRHVVVDALAGAVRRGSLSGGRTMAHKVMEALGAQTTIQALMEGMNLPAYVSASEGERTDMFIRNIIGNTALAGMEVPGLLSRRASGTQGKVGTHTLVTAQAGEVLMGVLNDPAMLKEMRIRADDAARSALDPNALHARPGRFQEIIKQPPELQEVPAELRAFKGAIDGDVVTPVTEPEPPVKVAPETPVQPKQFEDRLSPTDSLAVMTETATPSSAVSRVSKIINDAGKEVYSITYTLDGGTYQGYSDNPIWEGHPGYLGESKVYAKEFAAKRAKAKPPEPGEYDRESPEGLLVVEAMRDHLTTRGYEASEDAIQLAAESHWLNGRILDLRSERKPTEELVNRRKELDRQVHKILNELNPPEFEVGTEIGMRSGWPEMPTRRVRITSTHFDEISGRQYRYDYIDGGPEVHPKSVRAEKLIRDGERDWATELRAAEVAAGAASGKLQSLGPWSRQKSQSARAVWQKAKLDAADAERSWLMLKSQHEASKKPEPPKGEGKDAKQFGVRELLDYMEEPRGNAFPVPEGDADAFISAAERAGWKRDGDVWRKGGREFFIFSQGKLAGPIVQWSARETTGKVTDNELKARDIEAKLKDYEDTLASASRSLEDGRYDNGQPVSKEGKARLKEEIKAMSSVTETLRDQWWQAWVGETPTAWEVQWIQNGRRVFEGRYGTKDKAYAVAEKKQGSGTVVKYEVVPWFAKNHREAIHAAKAMDEGRVEELEGKNYWLDENNLVYQPPSTQGSLPRNQSEASRRFSTAELSDMDDALRFTPDVPKGQPFPDWPTDRREQMAIEGAVRDALKQKAGEGERVFEVKGAKNRGPSARVDVRRLSDGRAQVRSSLDTNEGGYSGPFMTFPSFEAAKAYGLADVRKMAESMHQRKDTKSVRKVLENVLAALDKAEAKAPAPEVGSAGKEEMPRDYSITSIRDTFQLSTEQATAIDALLSAVGLDTGRIRFGEEGVWASDDALLQMENILLGREKVPQFEKIDDVFKFVDKYGKKHHAVPAGLDLSTSKGRAAAVDAIVKHTVLELDAWKKVVKNYRPFYTSDIIERTNPALQKWAQGKFGRKLTTAEVDYIHLLSSLASGRTIPSVDTQWGMHLFEEYIRTGEATGLADKRRQLYGYPPGVTDSNQKKPLFIDAKTGKDTFKGAGNKPKYDPDPNAKPKITATFYLSGLQRFNAILGHFGGDLPKTIKWMGTRHTFDEIRAVIGDKAAKSLEEHENLDKGGLTFGTFTLGNDAKMGSYILNRWQKLGTITKDMWVARTTARWFREPSESGKPWALTKDGIVKRKILDEAWGIVAKRLGVDPANIQEMMWDAEKQIYGKFGPFGDGAYTSDARELETSRRANDNAPAVGAKDTATAGVGKSKKLNPLYQGGGDGGKPKGSTEFGDAGDALLRGFADADISTALHEVGHVIRRFLLDRSILPENRLGITDADIATTEQWAGAKDGVWTRPAEEKFARGLENYMRTGKAPNPGMAGLFEKFAGWLTNIYKKLKGSAVDVEVSPAMREVFDRLLTRTERLKQGGRMDGQERPTSMSGRDATPPAEGEPDLVLLGCGKEKVGGTAMVPAADLYIGPLFKARLKFADGQSRPWMILSAAHGVVEPGKKLASYDVEMSKLSPTAKEAWRDSVRARVLEYFDGRSSAIGKTIEVHAGADYVAQLEKALTGLGVTVLPVFKGKGIGEQLSGYSKGEARAKAPAGGPESTVSQALADGKIAPFWGAVTGDRPMIVVKIGTGHLPFYRSAMGTGGNKKAGEWQPFFGVGNNGWLIKGDGQDIAGGYGSHEVKATQKWLNENFNWEHARDLDLVYNAHRSPLNAMGNPGSVFAALKQLVGEGQFEDLRHDTAGKSHEHIMRVLESVGIRPGAGKPGKSTAGSSLAEQLAAAEADMVRLDTELAAARAEADEVKASGADFAANVNREAVVKDLMRQIKAASDRRAALDADVALETWRASVPRTAPPDGDPKVTAKILKVQKKFLLEATEQALAEAGEDMADRPKQITIEVPGDGTFTVQNTEKTLGAFHALVKARFSTSPNGDGGSGNKSVDGKPVPKPPKKGKDALKNVMEVAGTFVGEDDGRTVLWNSRSNGSEVVATDGMMMIRIDTPLAPGTPDNPVYHDAKGKPVTPKSIAVTYPDYKRAWPVGPTLARGGVELADLWHIVRQAKVFRDLSVDVADRAGERMLLVVNPDGSMGGAMNIGEDSFSHNISVQSKPLGHFNPDYIQAALEAAGKLGDTKLDIYVGGEAGPILIQGKQFGMVAMALSNGVDSVGATSVLRERLAAFADSAGKAEHPRLTYGDAPNRGAESAGKGKGKGKKGAAASPWEGSGEGDLGGGLGAGPTPAPADNPRFSAFDALPMELPEAVRFAREMLDGKYPKVLEIIKALGGRAAGLFTYTQGEGGKGEIHLKADLVRDHFKEFFDGTAEARYKQEAEDYARATAEHGEDWREIAKERLTYLVNEALEKKKAENPAWALKVIWHEIGHLVDWLPERMIHGRGNLFGRIASLKEYWKTTLPIDPLRPSGKPLSAADRTKLWAEADKQIRDEIGPISEIVETIMVEEPILRLVGITTEDVKNLLGMDAREKTPELYRWFAEQPAQVKKDILKKALRGLLDERLKAMGRMEQVGTKTTQRTVRKKQGREPTQEEVRARFKQLFREEMTKRNLADYETLKAELEPMIAWWRGTATMEPYFRTSIEMYAEAFSVLMNNPAAVAQRAPLYYRLLFNHMDAKPAVKQLYREIQDQVRRGSVMGERVGALRDMWAGDDARSMKRWRDSWRTSARDFFDNVSYQIDRRFGPIFRAAKGSAREGRVRDAVGNFLYRASEHELFLNRVNRDVSRPLVSANLDWTDLGEYMFHQRIVADRFALFNPQGWTSKNSLERLAELRSQLGPDRWRVLENAQREFRRVYEAEVLPVLRKARMFSPETQKLIEDKVWYATFASTRGEVKEGIERVLEDSVGAAVGARIYRQIGNLGEIKQPATATVLKALSLISAAERNIARREVVQMLLATDPSSIMPAKTRWNGKRMEVVERETAKVGTVIFMHEGKAKGFYVRRSVSESLNYASPIENKLLSGVVSANGWLKGLYTQLNYGFWPVNFAIDTASFMLNMPGVLAPVGWALALPRAVRAAHASVNGRVANEYADAALRRRMLISRADPRGVWSSVDNEFDLKVASYGMDPAAWGAQANKVGALVKLWNHYREFGSKMERVNKIAGMIYLDEHHPAMPEWKKREIVRERAGSPDFLQRGASNATIDLLMMFFNPWKEGIRSTMKAAGENPFSYGTKFAAAVVLPSLLQAAATQGLLGDDLKRKYRSIPDYDLSNYYCVPLFWQDAEAGKVAYLRLPLPEPMRIGHALTYKVATGRGMGYGSFMGGQVPGANSMYGVLAAWHQYAVMGHNPYDSHRGAYVLDEATFEAGGTAANVALGKWTWNQLGGSILGRFQNTALENPPASAGEEFLAAPIVSNSLGRWLKVSSRGIDDADRQLTEPVRQHRAEVRLGVRKIMLKLFADAALTPAERVLMREPYAMEYLLRTMPEVAAGREFPIMRRLGHADSREGKAAILMGSPQ